MSTRYNNDRRHGEENRAVGYDLQDGGFAIRDPYEQEAWIKVEVPRYLDEWW